LVTGRRMCEHRLKGLGRSKTCIFRRTTTVGTSAPEATYFCFVENDGLALRGTTFFLAAPTFRAADDFDHQNRVMSVSIFRKRWKLGGLTWIWVVKRARYKKGGVKWVWRWELLAVWMWRLCIRVLELVVCLDAIGWHQCGTDFESLILKKWKLVESVEEPQSMKSRVWRSGDQDGWIFFLQSPFCTSRM
jgi:hypothetical protein